MVEYEKLAEIPPLAAKSIECSGTRLFKLETGRFANSRNVAVAFGKYAVELSMVEDERKDAYGSACVVSAYNAGHLLWRRFPAYLVDYGISAITLSNGSLYIGTNTGDVECIEASTGTSLWEYAFPTIRSTMSWSSGAMGPTMDDAARIFRDENQQSKRSAGMARVPNDWYAPYHLAELQTLSPSKVPFIWDPKPVEPYKDLPRFKTYSFAYSLAPLLLLAALLLLPKVPARSLLVGIASLAGILTEYINFFGMGRVSPANLKAMLASFGICLLCSIGVCTLMLWKRQRIRAAAFALTTVGLILGLYYAPDELAEWLRTFAPS